MFDACLEVSGSYAHLVGVDVVHSILPARFRAWRRSAQLPLLTDGFEERLVDAVERLPILLAHVLWLVDVCGCTYETAAAELGRSSAEVETLVAAARRQLRDELVTDPRRSPARSTSPSRQAWRPPDR